jgi:outer membrane protein
LAVPFAAAQATDIGSVDMTAVLEKSKMGLKVQEQLRKELEPKAVPMREEEKAIREAQASLAREAALMSKDLLDKKQAELKKRIEAFKKAAAPIQEEFMRVEQERSRELMAPAQKALEVVAKQKKLGMVIERGQGGVVFVDKALDITEDVIKQMDANTK